MWDRKDALRIFAIVETNRKGKCGIVMTGESKRALKTSLGRMILSGWNQNRNLEIVEFKAADPEPPKETK
jgi:hypothetical protein